MSAHLFSFKSITDKKPNDDDEGNPQDPKRPDLHRGVSRKTATFLSTKHDPQLLRKLSSVEIPEDDLDESERALIDSIKSNYQSVDDNNDDDASVESDYDNDDSDAWYNQEPDTLADFCTVKNAVVGIGWLGLCGVLGYYVLYWSSYLFGNPPEF